MSHSVEQLSAAASGYPSKPTTSVPVLAMSWHVNACRRGRRRSGLVGRSSERKSRESVVMGLTGTRCSSMKRRRKEQKEIFEEETRRQLLLLPAARTPCTSSSSSSSALPLTPQRCRPGSYQLAQRSLLQGTWARVVWIKNGLQF